MPSITLVFAGIAAAIHALFFMMESVFFMNPRVHRNFGVKTPEDANLLKIPMFNQGFYNLFLALGTCEGIYFVRDNYETAGITLVLFCCGCMVLASVVLLISKPGMLRGVLIQGLCPLVAILTYWLSR